MPGGYRDEFDALRAKVQALTSKVSTLEDELEKANREQPRAEEVAEWRRKQREAFIDQIEDLEERSGLARKSAKEAARGLEFVRNARADGVRIGSFVMGVVIGFIIAFAIFYGRFSG